VREQQIRSLPPGVNIRDDVVKGLKLRTFAGRKSFYLYYRFNGRQREPKIGDWPVPLSLTKARKIAKDMLFEVASGRDPQAERKAARTAPTVKDLCERYWDEQGSSKKSASNIESLIRVHIEPKLGRERVAGLTYTKIYEWHLSLKGIRSNRALGLLSAMCNFAERWGWRPPGSNPCSLVQRRPEKRRQRYMTAAEAVRVNAELEKLEATRPQAVAFLYLLIYTGARCGEIAKAGWQDLDGNVLRLPDSKSGHPRSIHLPEPAMKVLERIPRISETITGIKDPKSCWIVVRNAAGCPDLRIHDLRHSFASAALAAGIPLSQIGKLLGHENAETTNGYAHLMEEVAQETAEATGREIERRLKRRLKG
jgi:integrase